MINLFISYSRKDSKMAERIRELLMRCGYEVWMDQYSISPGLHWEEEIRSAIHQADCMIILISSNSIDSDYVQEECAFAIEQGKSIIGFILDDFDYGLPENMLFLKRIHHIQVIGDDINVEALAYLVKSLHEFIPKFVERDKLDAVFKKVAENASEIQIMATASDAFATRHYEFLARKLGDKCRVMLLVTDPESDSNGLDLHDEITKSSASQNTQSVEEEIFATLRIYSTLYHDGLEAGLLQIRLMKTFQPYTIVAKNLLSPEKNGWLWVQHMIYRDHFGKRPNTVLIPVGQNAHWFRLYQQQFKSIWDDSREVTLEEIIQLVKQAKNKE